MALPYYIAYLTPSSVILCYALGGAWTFQTLLWVYGLIPLIDAAAGVDDGRGARRADRPGLRETAYKLPLWLAAPAQLALIAWALWTITSRPLSAVEVSGMTVSLGVASGVFGITAAHELIHRRTRPERLLGRVLMASVSYTHFAIEHVRGHHRRVGTPEDPATARLGESVYAFWPRCVWGSLVSAWRLERDRLGRRGHGPLSPRNEMLWFALAQVAVWAGVGAAFGWRGLAVFLVQGLIALTLLEVINYIEHYGLERRALAPGRYERVAARHSWSSGHRVTNWFLFALARHADHHLDAGRAYQRLRHRPEGPRLPAGYGAMVLLALVPPLWRRVMDPRAAAWQGARHHPGR